MRDIVQVRRPVHRLRPAGRAPADGRGGADQRRPHPAPAHPLPRDRHHVLGNHCVDTLTKEEFLDRVGQERSFYSFDVGGYHFVVLDACFRSDGQPYGRKNFEWTDANIPAHEVEWLEADLASTSRPTIVFAHQRR